MPSTENRFESFTVPEAPPEPASQRVVRSGTPRVLTVPFFSNNPYQTLLCDSMREQGLESVGEPHTWYILRRARLAKAAVVHFHWLHPWFAKTSRMKFPFVFPYWVVQLAVLRALGMRIVWTVHNLQDHENRGAKRDFIFSNVMARMCHVLICHSRHAAKETARFYHLNPKKIQVVPHGNYIGWYDSSVSKNGARKRLGIPDDARVIVAFGEIRPYKNTVELIEAFKSSSDENSYLLIAGRCHSDSYQRKIEAALEGSERVIAHLKFIPDDEVQLYLKAADIAALPYRGILTSGAALLAMSFGLPIIAPKLPSFEELPGEKGAFLYESTVGGLAKSLQNAFCESDRLTEMALHNRKMAEQANWASVAQSTIDAYGLCERSH